MRATRIVLGTAFVTLLGMRANAPAIAAESVHPGPRLLTSSQMDHVTAGGITLNASTGALAVGGLFALTEANAAGASGSTSLPGGGSIQSGAVIGAAVGYAPGGTASASTTTSGSVSGTSMTISTSGGATFPGGQAALSGTFLAGGPTFLP